MVHGTRMPDGDHNAVMPTLIARVPILLQEGTQATSVPDPDSAVTAGNLEIEASEACEVEVVKLRRVDHSELGGRLCMLEIRSTWSELVEFGQK